MTEQDVEYIVVDARIAVALERIATALEQGILEGISAPVAKGQVGAFDDPYPAELSPADEVADLPPVVPVNLDGCPIHHAPWKTVPAGTSKKTGRPYSAFKACSVAGCDQRPRL